MCPICRLTRRMLEENMNLTFTCINSVSGKGGVSFVLKQQFGFSLPTAMKEEVGYLIKGVSDKRHQELHPAEIYQIFEENYISPRNVFRIPECHFKQEKGILAEVSIEQNGSTRVIRTAGNGRLDAVSNAIKTYFGMTYELSVYEEHAISKGSSSKAAAYVGIVHDGHFYWGVGVDEDIIKASIAALTSAANKLADRAAHHRGQRGQDCGNHQLYPE